MTVARTLLIAVALLGAGIWIGSLVCLTIVTRVASQVLDPTDSVTLFRGIGRLYGVVGTGALLVAIASGVVIAGRPSNWGAASTAAIVLSGVLVVLTLAGMAQARRMTRTRRRALETPDVPHASDAVRRGATVARWLRSAMGAMTLAILAVIAAELGR